MLSLIPFHSTRQVERNCMRGNLQPHSHPNDFPSLLLKKVFIVTRLLLLYVLVFWQWDMWDIGSLTRDWTWYPPEMEGELTTGLPGKTLPSLIWNFIGSGSGLAGSREKCVAAGRGKIFHRIKGCVVTYTMFLLTTLNRAVLLLESNESKETFVDS